MRITVDPHNCWDAGMLLTSVLAVWALVIGSLIFWPAALVWCLGVRALFDPEPW